MKTKPAACAGCPAADYGLGFVASTPARTTPAFAVVGQGPGEQEATFSQPFYPGAPSGRMLRGWLYDAGIPEGAVTFGNCVNCWLPEVRGAGGLGRGSRPPTTTEIQHCYREYGAPWLYPLPETTHLLAVGTVAARFLLGLGPKEGAEHLAGVTHLITLPEVPHT